MGLPDGVMLMGFGISALVRPISVPPAIAGLDIWVMLTATALLIVVAISGWRIVPVEGATMPALYIGYVGWLVVGA